MVSSKYLCILIGFTLRLEDLKVLLYVLIDDCTLGIIIIIYLNVHGYRFIQYI